MKVNNKKHICGTNKYMYKKYCYVLNTFNLISNTMHVTIQTQEFSNKIENILSSEREMALLVQSVHQLPENCFSVQLLYSVKKNM